jgi:hypothetical protein
MKRIALMRVSGWAILLVALLITSGAARAQGSPTNPAYTYLCIFTGKGCTPTGWANSSAADNLTNAATQVYVSSTGSQLGMLACGNSNAAWAYVQMYDALAANVTVGTTPSTNVLAFPPGLTTGFAFGITGLQFNTAITLAATTTYSGSVAPSNNLNCTVGYR